MLTLLPGSTLCNKYQNDSSATNSGGLSDSAPGHRNPAYASSKRGGSRSCTGGAASSSACAAAARDASRRGVTRSSSSDAFTTTNKSNATRWPSSLPARPWPARSAPTRAGCSYAAWSRRASGRYKKGCGWGGRSGSTKSGVTYEGNATTNSCEGPRPCGRCARGRRRWPPAVTSWGSSSVANSRSATQSARTARGATRN